MINTKFMLQGAFIASKKLGTKVRPIVTSIRYSGRWLFSDKMLLYTNTGLSIGLSVAGDMLQQNYKRFKDGNPKKWDKMRTSQMAASGLAVGPVVHYWYLYLDRWFPGRNVAALLKKVTLDQIVLSPVYITLFLVTIGALEGQGWSLLKKEFRDTGVSMFIADVLIWTPAQTVNFYFVPTRFRVLFDSFVSLGLDVWFSYLRFDRRSIQPEAQEVTQESSCMVDCQEVRKSEENIGTCTTCVCHHSIADGKVIQVGQADGGDKKSSQCSEESKLHLLSPVAPVL